MTDGLHNSGPKFINLRAAHRHADHGLVGLAGTPRSTRMFSLEFGFLGSQDPGEALFPKCQEGLISQRKGGMPLVAAAFQFVCANHAEQEALYRSRDSARVFQFVGLTRAMPADGTLRAKRNPMHKSRRSTGLACRSAERHSAAGSLWQPPRATRNGPPTTRRGFVTASSGYGSFQSAHHSHTFPCMSYSPSALAA
jgi:hypothetical protein